MTVVKPVPGEALGGFSAGPLSTAVNVIGDAYDTEVNKDSIKPVSRSFFTGNLSRDLSTTRTGDPPA